MAANEANKAVINSKKGWCSSGYQKLIEYALYLMHLKYDSTIVYSLGPRHSAQFAYHILTLMTMGMALSMVDKMTGW